MKYVNAKRAQRISEGREGTVSRAQTREESRRLMRRLIADRLPGQTLKTRDVLKELQDL